MKFTQTSSNDIDSGEKVDIFNDGDSRRKTI